MGVGQAEADVIAQCTHVSHMVVHALELEKNSAQFTDPGGYLHSAGLFDGKAVGEAVADRAVPGDPFGQGHRGLPIATFEETLYFFVDEPEPCLHLHDWFDDHPKSEVPGLDEPSVDQIGRAHV